MIEGDQETRPRRNQMQQILAEILTEIFYDTDLDLDGEQDLAVVLATRLGLAGYQITTTPNTPQRCTR
jgi:hypothetical protein